MSLDYTTANTGVFYRLGRLVKEANLLAAEAAGRAARLKNVVDPFELADLTAQVGDLYAGFDGFRSGDVGRAQQVAAVADAVLSDRVTVLAVLGLTAFSADTFFPALTNAIVQDGASVDRTTVTVGSVTPVADTVGDGTVLLTKRLDGFNPPLAGGVIDRRYGVGLVDSELACTETMTFTCTTDVYGGATEGGESFRWSGAAASVPFDTFEGSGVGPQLDACGSSALPLNGTFEAFATTNTPDSWTVANGTVGTHIFQTTTSGQYYRGTSALKLTGDGSQATISLTQAVGQTTLGPLRMYCLTLRLKCSANAPAAGNFTAMLTGTGYTAASTDKISVAHGSLTTAWTLQSCFILVPATVPSDLALELKWAGTPTNAVSLYIDDVFLTPVVYHGGVGAVVVPGATPFLAADGFTAAIANDGAGVFQEFLRRQYRWQAPSAASPTISDALAT